VTEGSDGEIELMLRHGGGAIVKNASSGAGVKGFKGQAAYAATKHGLIGLTKSAALHYAAQGIRINAISPRHHRQRDDAPLHRRHRRRPRRRDRAGADRPVAAAVLGLSSHEAAFTIGHAMVVDGGQTA